MSDNKEKKVNIKPLAKLVLARVDDAPATTPSGLYLPKDAVDSDEQKTATVAAVGPEVKDVKVGDKIIYENYSGTKVKRQDEEYVLVAEEKVLAVVA